MDFLKEFRHTNGHGSEEWAPSEERFLGLAELNVPQARWEPEPEPEPELQTATPMAEWAPPQAEHRSSGAYHDPLLNRGEAIDPRHADPVDNWVAPAESWVPASAQPSWVSAPPSPSPKRRARLIAAASLVAIAALIGGLVAVVGGVSRGSSHPSSWDPRVAAIANFVQSDRGLSWKHPVKVEFLPAAQFVAKISGAPGKAPSGPTEQQLLSMLRAVGVVWGDVNLSQAEQNLAANDVVGLYVDTDKTVYVKGDVMTPDVKVTLAHELTHALQDQYYNLEQMKSGNADADGAVTALIEGDAVRVQQDYLKTLPADQQAAALQASQQGSSQAQGQNAAEQVPPFLADEVQFPYDFGPSLIQALLQEGGNAKVDAAFANPPTLDGQLVQPSSYQPGLPVQKVTAPTVPSGAKTVAPATPFGQVPLLEMLGYEVGFNSAWQSLQGWTADEAVAYDQFGRTCVGVSVLADSSNDAATLGQVGTQWAARIPGASASVTSSTVTFRSCDPGSSWRPAMPTPDPYSSLATRAVWIGQIIQGSHVNAVAASCITDQLMTTLGVVRMGQLETLNTLTPAQGLLVESAIREAVPACGVTAADLGNG